MQNKYIFVNNHSATLKQEHLTALRKIMAFLKQNKYNSIQIKKATV